MLFDHEIWPSVSDDDLWIFDKLIVSRRLGHLCGPSGVDVPQPNYYVVRPCVNLGGMGRGASIQWLTGEGDETWYLPPGSFWQQRFLGRHLSVDYQNGDQIRCSQGFRNSDTDLSRFDLWKITNDQPQVPDLIRDIIEKYPLVNVEMIGGNIIEIHLRGNPDFDDGATEIIPVWKDQTISCPDGYVYVADESYDRMGFYKKYN